MGLWEIIKGEQPGILQSWLNYENKGQYGEYLLTYALNHDNLPGYLKTIRNLYVPYQQDTSEIDVLMVHEKGLFVFESKNYSGWIFGSAGELKWTQCLPNHGKHHFYNPIRQNETHIKALSKYMQLPQTSFMSYIIFSERCELKDVPEATDFYSIVKRPELLKKLREMLKSRSVQYTHQEVDSLAEKFTELTRVSEEEKQRHIDVIKQKEAGTVCPFCGSPLVLRKGKYGDFYGCSTYPKCKFTKKL